MRPKIWLLLESIRSSYWFVPGLMALGGIALSLTLVMIDQRYPDMFGNLDWVYRGGPEGARAVLAAIAGSTITVAGTTFSILIAALSLASNQYGPRVLRNFMRDRGNHVVLGAFTSTFLYCLLTLRAVRGVEDDRYVPHLAVSVGVLLAVFSVGILIYFIHHAAESIQASRLVDVIGSDIDALIAKNFPREAAATGPDPALPAEDPVKYPSPAAGYLEAVDEGLLLDLATQFDRFIALDVRTGDYVLPGQPLARIFPDVPAEMAKRLERGFAFGRVRTGPQDPEFGFLQLVEVAVRALSPGIHDPFTAMLCLDRLSTSLALLMTRQPPSPHLFDQAGGLRVVIRRFTHEELVRVAFRMIRQNAGNHPAVLERIAKLLDQLRDTTAAPAVLRAIGEERAALRQAAAG